MRFDSPVQRASHVPQRDLQQNVQMIVVVVIILMQPLLHQQFNLRSLDSFQIQITPSTICEIVYVQTMSAGD